jgi:hypothetical protein
MMFIFQQFATLIQLGSRVLLIMGVVVVTFIYAGSIYHPLLLYG